MRKSIPAVTLALMPKILKGGLGPFLEVPFIL